MVQKYQFEDSKSWEKLRYGQLHILDFRLSASDHDSSARRCKNWPIKCIGSIQLTFYILT